MKDPETAVLKLLQNRCSQTFRNIHVKTTLTERLFQYSCRLKAYKFIKKETLIQVTSCELGGIFKSTFLQNEEPLVVFVF